MTPTNTATILKLISAMGPTPRPFPVTKAPIEKREQVILQALTQAGRPLLLKEMEYLLPQLGISRDSLRICCDRMTDKGLIARTEIKVRYARAAFTYEVNR